jgi:uncharacterized hydrophobic protein (TIGR00271 family)
MTSEATSSQVTQPQWSRRVTPADVERLTGKLLLTEGSNRRVKLSAFWVLIILATVIACAGVIGDSTATVIGAMIVAPLMTPILGTALSVVLARRRLIVTNLLMVLAGAAVVVGIAYLMGTTTHLDIIASTNTQVAGRVSPRLIDLIGALATGGVGAFAMVRADVSDTLPGVAIAISLVPPLAVVGLTLESGAPGQAAGALLLFGTNVCAIIATGTLVFLSYGVRSAAMEANVLVGPMRNWSLVAVLAALAILAVPLAWGSSVVVRQEALVARATPTAQEWAESQGWQIGDIAVREGALRIVALGPAPEADPSTLRRALDEAGLADVDVRVTLVIGGSKDLPADG